jgi:hypothetical protein
MLGSNIFEMATGLMFIFILVSTIYMAHPGHTLRRLIYDMDSTGLAKVHLPAGIVNINATPDPPLAGGDATGQNQPATNMPADNDELDGCDVEATDLTGDEDLPESKGGMI